MSNYWTSDLFVKFKNGSFAPVPIVGDPGDVNGGMTVYYLQRRRSDASEQLHAFPEGFRMIADDATKRNFTGDLVAKAVTFSCLGANQPETNGLPNYNCPGGLRAQVFFPSCWNGKDSDSPDHQTHMSYPVGQFADNGACPSSHPVHLISIFFEILYDTNHFADQWDNDQHPFLFRNGDAAGYGFHGDFVNGWDVDVLQVAVDSCTDASGQVERCAAVTMYTAQECNTCKLPITVTEVVHGLLTTLPGCNPITHGPERAVKPASCSANDNVTISASAYRVPLTDLTQSHRWSYTSCGTDSPGDRAFTGSSITTSNMAVEYCVSYCSGLDFSYAGLEYGTESECYCANELRDEYAPKDGYMGSCAMECAGNADQICGSAAAMSIYQRCDADAYDNVEFGDRIEGKSRGSAVGLVV